MEGEILNMVLWDDRLDVSVKTSPHADESWRSIPLDGIKSKAKALKDAVYDDTIPLVGDYDEVRFAMDTPRMMVAPAAMSDPTLRQQMMSVLWPGDDYEVMADHLTDADTLLWGADREILSFVRRTFDGVAVTHRLSPEVVHYYDKNREDNLSRMYARLWREQMDIVYIRDGILAVANTYRTPSEADMMYYIMCAAQVYSFSQEYDELVLVGDEALTRHIKEEADKYIANVVCREDDF